MKNLLLLFAAMLLIHTYYLDIDVLVSKIEKRNVFETSYFGAGIWDDNNLRKFEVLKKRASREKLLELLEHPSEVVTAYSAMALIDREEVDPKWLFEKFLDDERLVLESGGCFVSSSTLYTIIYYHYLGTISTYENLDTGERPKIFVENNDMLLAIDSLILFGETDWDYLLFAALDNRIYQGSYLDQIKYLSYEEMNLYAIQYLYKNCMDTEEEKLREILQLSFEKAKDPSYEKTQIQELLRKWKPAKKPEIDSIQILVYEGDIQQ